MIFNLSALTGRMLLATVDQVATQLRKDIPSMAVDEQFMAIKRLQHLGVVKHRLEHGLGFADPFRGPSAWGYPITRQDLYS